MIPATYVPALCEITTSMIEKSESELTAAIEAQKKKMSKNKNNPHGRFARQLRLQVHVVLRLFIYFSVIYFKLSIC